MANLSEVKKHWNNIGSDYNKCWKSKAQKIMSKKELNLIKDYISKDKISIFDYGVGMGRIIENEILFSNDNSIISGVDVSEEMVSYCKDNFTKNSKIKSLEVINNISELDNKKFDLITSIRVLKYNSDWDFILKKLIHKLNKKGILIFTLPNKKSINILNNPKITYIKKSVSEIKKILNNNNMEILEIIGFSRIPDFFYQINSSILSSFVIQIENSLDFILGKKIIQKEVFYIARKK